MSEYSNQDIYGVEIVGKTAYTEKIQRSETAFGKQRNDFEGTRVDCIEYIESKGIKEIIGSLDK